MCIYKLKEVKEEEEVGKKIEMSEKSFFVCVRVIKERGKKKRKNFSFVFISSFLCVFSNFFSLSILCRFWFFDFEIFFSLPFFSFFFRFSFPSVKKGKKLQKNFFSHTPHLFWKKVRLK